MNCITPFSFLKRTLALPKSIIPPRVAASRATVCYIPTMSEIVPPLPQPPEPRRTQCVLAPMVRTGELPTRLMALKYGADLVWGPETVDKAIIGSTRTPNPSISCIDFTKGSNNRPGDAPRVVFRTHPEREQNKLIFQLGTASPELAVEAAKLVARDVAGIDVNAGCPKHFSIHSGMGAALLQTPDKLCAILTSLINAVGPGTEYNVPISVKIRLLDPYTATFGLVEKLTKTGIHRLTVHMRTTPMRPREAAIREPEIIKGIARICHDNGVKIFLNGDVSCQANAEELCAQYDLDGCMIARAAETNTSCFVGSINDIVDWKEVAQKTLQTAMEVDNNFSNTKFILSHIIEGKHELYNLVTRSKTFEEMCIHLGVEYISGALTSRLPEVPKPVAVQKAKQGKNETAIAAGRGKSGGGKGKRKLSERGVVKSSPPASAKQTGAKKVTVMDEDASTNISEMATASVKMMTAMDEASSTNISKMAISSVGI